MYPLSAFLHNANFEQVADVTILASWYRENKNHENPVVIIVGDTERCCGSVLSDLILILRYEHLYACCVYIVILYHAEVSQLTGRINFCISETLHFIYFQSSPYQSMT